jgi:hypothetical protein
MQNEKCKMQTNPNVDSQTQGEMDSAKQGGKGGETRESIEAEIGLDLRSTVLRSEEGTSLQSTEYGVRILSEQKKRSGQG